MILLDLVACIVSRLADRYAPPPKPRPSPWADETTLMSDAVAELQQQSADFAIKTLACPLGCDRSCGKCGRVGVLEPMPSWVGGEQGFDDEPPTSPAPEVSSAGVSEAAGVEERPAPTAAFQGGAGHPTLSWDEWDSALFAIRRFAETRCSAQLQAHFLGVAAKLQPFMDAADSIK